MAKKSKVGYLIVTAVFCVISTLLVAAALATDNWITSSPVTVGSTVSTSSVSYGLYKGYYKRQVLGTNEYTIKLTYLFSENAGAWSFRESADERKAEVQTAYDNFDHKDEFINVGMWLCVLIFISLSLLFSVVSSIMSIYNTLTNPIETYAGAMGLYIWLGTAGVCDILVLVLFGAEFGSQLKTDIALVDTINGALTSDGLSGLGYSYFLVLVAFVIREIGIVLIFLRERALNKAKDEDVIKIDDKDNGILY